ncbi:hypothetical protein L6164_003313 [Bauhinia variegata]|uniref:Uncharacterized protein n=1 Tax=Bauhinia variegata TaxID=167791 RepID=A0ACB9Q128_BAUVA|nr:hypothetical protein L6164_003313 [Bauhinia variegata]
MIPEREQIKYKFNDFSAHFEQAISNITCDKLDISEEVKEQVNVLTIVTLKFGRAKEHMEPPGRELHEYLLSNYNCRSDEISDSVILRVICEKLQFINVEDVKNEAVALHKFPTLVIPDEFRCPVSLELMKDPVIISTGQTYERGCIKNWLEAGHGTCTKTQQILSSNYPHSQPCYI